MLRRQDGTALVEFTLALPLLLLLVLGVVSFGFGFNYWINATHLASEAARYAAVDKNPGPSGTLQDSILQRANTDELRSGGTAAMPAPAQVCITYTGASVGDRVHVEVTLDYNWIPFFGDRVGIGSTQIRSTADMRLEARPTLAAGCSS